MNVVHLTDSPFFGGPERQMLGLSIHLSATVRTTILCFPDNASCVPFLEQLGRSGVRARMLAHGNPHFGRIVADVAAELRGASADVLICHGYKADVLGLIAGRRVGVPVLAVSRGWTGHTRKVRLNEAIDRRALRWMDAVICVSEGQAAKVRRAGVRTDRVRVIHNAIDASRFERGDTGGRAKLAALFPSAPELIAVGVGRLSPEKGFEQLVEAAGLVVADSPTIGFVLVGDGPDRAALEQQIRRAGLTDSVIFAGFRSDVDALLPGADMLVQSSYTEGLPNVVLEACAAGVPVVATDVGGTREVVRDGVNGYLVRPGDAPALAERIRNLVRSAAQRTTMGARGRDVVRSEFSFSRQAAQYEQLLGELVTPAAMPDAVVAV